MGISDWWKKTSGKADVPTLARDLMARARLAQRMGELDEEPAGLLLAAGAGKLHRRLRTLLVQMSGHESVDEERYDLVPRDRLDELIASCTGNRQRALELHSQLRCAADDRFVVLVVRGDGEVELHEVAWAD